MTIDSKALDLIEQVRAAASVHAAAWKALVPDSYLVNFAAEAEEEQAYAVMATAKARLRDHICDTYGVSIRELAILAQP